MTRFWYGHIQIDSVSDSSVVSIGQNLENGFTHVQKTNEGLGSVPGQKNQLVRNIHFVNDADDVDSWRNREWVQRDGM